jgi:hypothetical protein
MEAVVHIAAVAANGGFYNHRVHIVVVHIALAVEAAHSVEAAAVRSQKVETEVGIVLYPPDAAGIALYRRVLIVGLFLSPAGGCR